MEKFWIPLFIFASVTVAMLAQGWSSWLEHRRRTQILEVIRLALAAGKDPPAELYDQLRAGAPASPGGLGKPPWSEAAMFAALAFGFWLAFFLLDSERRVVFAVIAASMTATALGCLGLALWMSPKRIGDDQR